ncbi:unnamed protein product [Penicillium roqueforti FM164]|uniref:Genomic scaffold, ProqFM164S02 n=1 Tax=Penicillium roqueforti (strain FM164) TaxID=1365484 RepID=W6Q4Q2_PENRF|nr:unnamed protein product [Penicillium roqueforti FM164]
MRVYNVFQTWRGLEKTDKGKLTKKRSKPCLCDRFPLCLHPSPPWNDPKAVLAPRYWIVTITPDPAPIRWGRLHAQWARVPMLASFRATQTQNGVA